MCWEFCKQTAKGPPQILIPNASITIMVLVGHNLPLVAFWRCSYFVYWVSHMWPEYNHWFWGKQPPAFFYMYLCFYMYKIHTPSLYPLIPSSISERHSFARIRSFQNGTPRTRSLQSGVGRIRSLQNGRQTIELLRGVLLSLALSFWTRSLRFFVSFIDVKSYCNWLYIMLTLVDPSLSHRADRA